MKVPPKPPNTNPICCGEHSTWIDNGRTCQYFYCHKCKKEVKKEEPRKWGSEITFDDEHLSIRVSYPFTLSPPLSTAGQVFANNVSLTTPPTRLSLTELALLGSDPCHGSNHHWHSIYEYSSDLPCNCGLRIQ